MLEHTPIEAFPRIRAPNSMSETLLLPIWRTLRYAYNFRRNTEHWLLHRAATSVRSERRCVPLILVQSPRLQLAGRSLSA